MSPGARHRLLGAIVVVLAVVGLLAAANLSGRRVAGSADRTPIPAPPRVGDCLLELPTAQRSPLVFSGSPILHVLTGACGAENYGEIIFVASGVAGFPMSAAGGPDRIEPRD